MLANTTEQKIAQCEEEDDLKHFEDCTETGQG